MSETKVYTAIGLMSGTSLDGVVDVALLRTDGRDFVECLDFKPFPYDQSVRDKVRACFGKRESDVQVQEAQNLVTDIHIAAVKALGQSADIIGFHGQTITHDPQAGFTWQLGDPARLARETGIDVVFDLRQADIKAGGQGAPLLPLYHQALARDLPKPCAVLNLGGVGNVTWLGEGGDILAFDTGPANALIDDFVAARTGQSFDDNGALAQAGTPDEALLESWLADPYFDAVPPKSLDRNVWDVSGLELLSDADGAATLTQFTIRSVLKSLGHMKTSPIAWHVCGGGRKNAFIMKGLQDALGVPVAGVPVAPVETLGWNGDALEAQGFAYLAVRSLLGLPLTLPSTTGVKEPLRGGKLYTPSSHSAPCRRAQ